MPIALQAGLWGLLSGSALVIGAVIGWFVPLGRRVIAAIMAFGAGVLISALSFELIDEAWKQGGFLPVAGGFLGGALVYTGANWLLAHRGARHRKRSVPEKREKQAANNPENGAALALGALLDGIPESIVIGVSLLAGKGIGLVAVIAVFLSNIPEGLSSAAGMKHEGKKAGHVFGMWALIALASGIAATIGYLAFDGVPPAGVASVMAVAAGAILAMIVDTMVPEAFEGTHDFAGLIAVSGFLAAFALSRLA
ncbi:ZIP family zinc transporter [Sphingomonas rosea]|jgi:ZIP family zinc transporter|uniref:ZIP family zinc transporter n=1 Tax=Sphingomonas rosea TaxID=335605 RepID=A0ABP7UCR8_9SPHN